MNFTFNSSTYDANPIEAVLVSVRFLDLIFQFCFKKDNYASQLWACV